MGIILKNGIQQYITVARRCYVNCLLHPQDNKLSILVNQTHRRIPVRYIALTDDNLTIVDFKLFRRRAPAPEEFDVPKLCLSTPLPSPDDEDEAKDY
jgi:hypothetical protein